VTRSMPPGSLGCHTEPVAPFIVVESERSPYKVEKRAVCCDDRGLFGALERRGVPERKSICQTFYGGRVLCRH